MATIVDALVVTLGLDNTAFKRSRAETSQATKNLVSEERAAARDVEASNKRSAESFTKVRNEVLALVAIFTAGMGIKNFVENTILSTASLQRLSLNLGMSTKDLAEWQLAAKNAGGSAEGITRALQESQQAAAKAKLGQFDPSTISFLRWGGRVEELRDGNTYLLARSRIIAGMFKVDPGRARLVAQQMGIDDDSFNLLKQGPEAVQRLRDQQRSLAEAQSRAAAPAEELRKKFDTLQNTLESIGVTVLTDLMPVFDRLIGYFQRLADWVDAHKADINKWVDGAVEALQRFAQWADKAAESVGGWKNVLIALAALKILSMSSGILSLAGAFLQLGTALGGVSSTGAAALPVLARLLAIPALAALALHSENLNEGEADYLKDRQAKPGQKWDGDPIGQKRRAGASKDPAARSAVEQMMAMGWTREQASGLVAGFWQESLLDPRAVGDGGKAYGIGQWHPDRQAEFKKLFGIDIQKSTLEQQLQFANYELTQGKEQDAGKRLRAATNALDAGAIASRYYERPADVEGEAQRRASAAADLYASIGQANAAQIASSNVGARSVAPVNNTTSTTTSSNEANFNGPITIHTQATDAAGLARDFHKEVSRFSFSVPQANTGLS